MNKSQAPTLLPMTQLALSVDSFARAMNIGRTSVYGLIKSGQIQSVMIAGRRLIPFSETNRLLCVVEQAEPQNTTQNKK
jgi:excisionase family DNA binding protein